MSKTVPIAAPCQRLAAGDPEMAALRAGPLRSHPDLHVMDQRVQVPGQPIERVPGQASSVTCARGQR